MQLQPDILKYFLFYIFSYFFISFIGALLWKLLRLITKAKADFTDELFSGLIFLVSAYAIYKTNFNSVFILSIFLLISFLIFYKKWKIQDTDIDLTHRFRNLVLYLPTVIISFGFFYFLFVHFSNAEVYVDYVFYANVSFNLSDIGVESSNIFLSENDVAQPYHFFELWLNSFFANIYRLSHLHTLFLITFPLLFSVLCIVLYRIVYKLTNNRILTILLLAVYPFVILPEQFFGGIGLIYNPKTIVIHLLLLMSLKNYIDNNYYKLIFTLALAPVIYTSITPGVYTAAFLSLVIFSDSIENIKRKHTAFIYVISGIIILGFYVINYFNIAVEKSNIETYILYDTPLISIKWVFMWLLKVLILLAIIYLIIYLYKGIALLKKQLVIFVVSGIAMSAFLGAFMRLYVRDGGQVFTNFTLALISLVIFLVIIFVLKRLKSDILKFIVVSFVVIVFGFGFLSHFPEHYNISGKKISDSEIKFLSTLNDIQPNERIGYFRNHNLDPNFRESLGVPLEKIAYFLPNGHYAPYWLSVFDIPINSQPIPKYNDDRTSSQLYSFIMQQNIDLNNRDGIENGIIHFIRQNRIKYIVIEKNANVPEYIKPFVKSVSEYDGNSILEFN